MSADPIIIGNRLHGATVRLMSALHVERMCEDCRDKAEDDHLAAFEDAVQHAHEQTRAAWKDCIKALEAWTQLTAPPAG